MFSNILHYLEGTVVFLIILMVLVAAHEFGHFLFACLFGMGVEEFSIGMFGKKPLLTWLRRTYRTTVLPGEEPLKRSITAGLNFEGGSNAELPEPVLVDGPHGQELEETTVFTIRPIPIGGFVRIKGMMPEEDGSETRIPGGFYSKPAWERFLVLLAGPVFSVLAGVLIMIPVFVFVGEPRSSNAPVLGAMLKGSPAEKAGFKPGDRIVSINGRPIQTFYQVIESVRDSANERLRVDYLRDGKQGETTVIPELASVALPVKGPDLQPTGEMRKQALIGVLQREEVTKLSLGEATLEALNLPVKNVRMLFSLFHTPEAAEDSVAGPVGMLTATTDAVQTGIADVFWLAAAISIGLGIINLLPIYPLDGGQMIVALAEMLRGGRRLSLRVQTMVGTVGLCLVVLMFIGAFTVDISRFRQKAPTEVLPGVNQIQSQD